MSQQRLRNYKHAILSFEHNLFNFGLHTPGRYVGFDTLVPIAGQPLQFKVGHSATGFTYKDQVNTAKGPIGVCMSAQGVLIQEDAEVGGPLTIETNAGNAETRYDLVVLNHQFTVVDGGADATYSIIKGPVGSPTKPVLADPLTQIAVGVLEIPAGAVDVSFCTYHKAKCPDSGDGEDARLDSPNIFGYVQQENLGTKRVAPTNTGVSGAITYNLWALENNGNAFEILPAANTTVEGLRIKDVPLQQGTRISIFINDKVTLREATVFNATNYFTAGYRPLKINSGLGNTSVVSAGGSTFGIKPTTGQIWEIGLIFYAGAWNVSYIGGAAPATGLSRGDIVWWYGDVNANFDDTGLGINLKNGTALCNGNNNTPDLRGKILAMATNVQAAGQLDMTDDDTITAGGFNPNDYVLGNYGTTQGGRINTLQQNNLPNCFFNVTDPGHFHYLSSASGSGTKYPGPNDYIAIGSNAANGNQDYDLCKTGVPATVAKSSIKTTGISVSSGGNGDSFSIVPPLLMLVAVMKL